MCYEFSTTRLLQDSGIRRFPEVGINFSWKLEGEDRCVGRTNRLGEVCTLAGAGPVWEEPRGQR